MATIGQILTVPEVGWRRYDNTDNRIEYLTNGVSQWYFQANNAWNQNNYNNTFAATGDAVDNTGSKIKFKFYGSKLRIISIMYPSGSRYSENIEIKIDGIVTDIFSEYSQTPYNDQRLVYEKSGLTLGNHSVEITVLDRYALGLDAIDIDSIGYLIHPILNQVNNVNNMQIGECILAKYTTTISGQPGTFTEIGTMDANSMIPTIGSATPGGFFYFIKVAKGLLIADRVVQHSISYDALNANKMIEGTETQISKYDNSKITMFGSHAGYGTTSPSKLIDDIITNDSINGGYHVLSSVWTSGNLLVGGIFQEPKRLFKLRYYVYTGAYQPYNFTIQGSNDTVTGLDGIWDTIKIYSAYPSITSGWGELLINSTIAYKAYRYNITNADGNNHYFLLNELEFIVYDNILPNNNAIIRSLSGGVAFADANSDKSLIDANKGAWPVNNEWDKYVVNSSLNNIITPGDFKIWNLYVWNWTKGTPVNGISTAWGATANTQRIFRGAYVDIPSNIKLWGNVVSTLSTNKGGFRPVLQYLESNSKAKNIWY